MKRINCVWLNFTNNVFLIIRKLLLKVGFENMLLKMMNLNSKFNETVNNKTHD